MSSVLVCAQPATGYPEVFVPRIGAAELLKNLSFEPHLSPVTSASHLNVRPAPEMVSCGISDLDRLAGGLPRGCLTEIYGPSSSGRTGLLLAALAASTRHGQACALVDVSNAFDPYSAAAAGMHFPNLLWIRCGADDVEPEQTFSEPGSSPPLTANNSSSAPRSALLSRDPLGEKHLAVKPRDMIARIRTENLKPHELKNLQVQQPGEFGIDYAQRKTIRSYEPRSEHKSERQSDTRGGSKSLSRNTGSSLAFEDRKLARNKEWKRLEQAVKATDLLLQSGGFGMVAIDLGDVPETFARRIPLTSWFRFRRAVENTATVLLVVAQAPCARTCASLLLRLEEQSSVAARESSGSRSENIPAHGQLLQGLRVHVELMRSRLERKPVRSASSVFLSKTAWAG
jgi:recombination protein RecA